MGKFTGRLIMRLGGWSYAGALPTDKKYVVISVPHTSVWDFVWGKLAFMAIGEKPAIFIKKESFFFPVGPILKALGAKPVNRGKGAVGLVDQVIHHFEKNNRFSVCITPEGTRSKVKKWKKGFYFIAQKANIPIYLGIIDYRKKVLEYGERFIPTGDIPKDMEYIKNYYLQRNALPKHPENFSWDIN